MDLDNVRRKIRGLLNLGENDGAAEGEITAAMNLAQQLLDKFHLERADVEATEPEVRAAEHYDAATVPGNKKWRLGWETDLAWACCKLLGTVQFYRSTGPCPVTVGVFQRPELRSQIVFYGPEEDARLAADLFGEWSVVIATMATARYGGFCAKHGGKYAMGFAESLYNKAIEIHKHRREIVTPSTTALVATGDKSLATVLAQKRKKSSDWLRREKGIHLSRGTQSSGYRAGSHDAYMGGKQDGARADFAAKRRPKLGGGQKALPG